MYPGQGKADNIYKLNFNLSKLWLWVLLGSVKHDGDARKGGVGETSGVWMLVATALMKYWDESLFAIPSKNISV